MLLSTWCDELCGDELCGEELCGDELCGEELCGEELCDEELCEGLCAIVVCEGGDGWRGCND